DLGLQESDAFYMLGMTFLKQKMLRAALPYLLTATELDNTDPNILFQYGLTLAQLNFIKDAKRVFKDVLTLEEEHSDALYNLRVIAVLNEQLNEALSYFNRALLAQPNHVLAGNGKKNVEERLHEQKE